MEELEKNETSTQAEENTVSLASAQALADALAKIEAYTPTTWVDNSSPDIDAEHLNKPEQAIKRVTDALNSAVDVIKDLQSQVTKNAGAISDVNNNLSNRFSSDSLVYNSIDDIPKSGSCFGTISKSIKIGTITIPAYSRFSFINTGTSTDGALFAIDSNGYSYTAYRTSGVWNKCFATATKDDLNTVLMYRGVITGDLNRGRNLVIAPGIYSIQSVSTITNGPSDFGGWGIFVQFPDNLFSQMILNSPNYIKFRKYSGQNPSWGAW